eukprot:scaffold9252_cov160-Skeletonema_marinoi.AAC.14
MDDVTVAVLIGFFLLLLLFLNPRPRVCFILQHHNQELICANNLSALCGTSSETPSHTAARARLSQVRPEPWMGLLRTLHQHMMSNAFSLSAAYML